ncbi:MAG: hypothetical protein ACM3MN_07465 [Nitrospirota bacterium]
MGFPGGEAPGSIPKPARNFFFTLVDLQGVETPLREFTIEGSLYLSGRHGKGTVTIPFERIRVVRFQAEGQELQAQVELTDGTTARVAVDGRKRCYGRMTYGYFQIELRDLQKMVNQGEAPR